MHSLMLWRVCAGTMETWICLVVRLTTQLLPCVKPSVRHYAIE